MVKPISTENKTSLEVNIIQKLYYNKVRIKNNIVHK